MDYEISDDEGFSDVTVTLEGGEQVKAEPGAMISYSPGVEMQTDTGGGGGLVDTAKRSMFGGESAFMNTFTATDGPGTVTFAPPAPGSVEARELNDETLYADSGAFLASDPEITVSSEFQGASKFFTSGDVFLLELSGSGTVLIDSYGAMKDVTLGEGEQYYVDTDHIVAFDSTVEYTIERAGGLKSRAFGGEGKVAKFTGPGTIWLQNRNFESLAEQIAAEIPAGGGGEADEDDGIGVGDFL